MTAASHPLGEPGRDATHFPLDEVMTLEGPGGATLRVHATELAVAADETGALRSCELRFRVTAARLIASGLLDQSADAPPVPDVPDDADVDVTARLRSDTTTTANAAALRRSLRGAGALTRFDRWDVTTVRLAGGAPWS